MRPRSAKGRKSAERAPTMTDAWPLAAAVGQAGMPFGRPCAKSSREPIEELCGERNLRQQHKRLPFLPQSLRDRLEINLGLSRPGHALEQGGRECAVCHEADEITGCGALVGVEPRR